MNIQTSTNYSEFKFLKKNRSIDYKKLLKFIKDSKENPHLMQLCPIIVNDNMEIMDGQHRFLACKENNLPVHFLKSKEIKDEDIIILNKNHSNWGIESYIKFHAESGNENYKKLIEFCNQNKCSYSIAMLFLGISNRKLASSIKEGSIVFPEESLACRASYMLSKCEEIKKHALAHKPMLNKEGVHVFAFGYSFMESISKLPLDCDLISFFEKLKDNIFKIQHASSFNAYLDQFIALGILR